MRVWAQRASIQALEPCFPGDTQLRVLGGWQRDGQGGGNGGVARPRPETVEGAEVMRGAAEERPEKSYRPGGWHNGGAFLVSLFPLVPHAPLFDRQHLRPALHAKHTLPRGRLHMGLKGYRRKAFLKQRWEKREVWVSSTASLSRTREDPPKHISKHRGMRYWGLKE